MSPDLNLQIVVFDLRPSRYCKIREREGEREREREREKSDIIYE
jgi:hypothetical protein